MKASSIKLTIMILFILILIGTYLGVGFLFTPVVQADQPVVDDPLDGLIPDDDNDGDLVIDSDDDEDEDEVVVLPTDPYKLVNYGLNKINNGKGYAGNISINLLAWGNFLGQDLVFEQKAIGTIAKCGDEALEEFYYYYEPTIDKFFTDHGYILDEYRAINTNTATNEAWLLKSKNSDHVNKTYSLEKDVCSAQAKSYEEMLEQIQIIYSLPLQINFNSNTAVVTQNNTQDKKYTIITMSINDSSIPYSYKAYYHAMVKEIPACNFSSLTFTFVVEKSTGNIVRIINNQNIYGSAKVFEGVYVDVKSSVSYVIDFTIIDEIVEIKKPYEAYEALYGEIEREGETEQAKTEESVAA